MDDFGVCFVNDGLVSTASAHIGLTDRGLTLGDAVFETMRVRDGRVIDIDAHLARLKAAFAGLGFPAVPDLRALSDALENTRAANGIVEGVLRLTVTRGGGGRGLAPAADLRPTVIVTASALPMRSPGFRAVTASVTRRNEQSPLSGIKSTSYLDNILALREALSRGADDALLLNTCGRAVCFSAANLFARVGTILVTPPLADGVMPGTVRRRMLEQLPVREVGLTLAELAPADEIIATNSLGIRQLVELDGKALSSEPILFGQARAIYDALT
jgi:branched-chain amino acid aminotransferase